MFLSISSHTNKNLFSISDEAICKLFLILSTKSSLVIGILGVLIFVEEKSFLRYATAATNT